MRVPCGQENVFPPESVARRMDQRLVKLRTSIRRRWLVLGEVLVESQESLAYRTLGFKNFQTFLGQRLEISAGWAMYLIKLVRKSRDFEIDRGKLRRLDISKCLEIFRLNDARTVRE